MERNVKLLLAYDGTDFHGWQRQAGVRTVQQELEDALVRLWGAPAEVLGASRTDAGVHARGQVAALRISRPIPLENLRRALGDRLPADVALLRASLAWPDFHPARHAQRKLYRYRIAACSAAAAALDARYVWQPDHRIQLERVRAAAAHCVGTHDFAGFASQGSPRDFTVRTIYRISVDRYFSEIHIDVEGDGFLYNQVRNLVGTLVEIGRERWPAERMLEVLQSRDRRLAGPTAPPHGLCLQWVRYGPTVSASDGAF
jgi:tRNA pseudouridine38-40 synthase